MNRLLTIALLTFAGLPTRAHAGNYGYSHRRQYVQPQYYQNFTAYFVGAPIRAEAIVKAELASDPAYQELQQFKQFRAEFEAWKTWKESQATAIPADALPVEQSALQRSCIRCHSPETPDGPKAGLDLTAPLSVESLKALKTKILADEMPPPSSPERKEWGPDGAGAVLSEAVDALLAE